jgi:hypothetical protein
MLEFEALDGMVRMVECSSIRTASGVVSVQAANGIEVTAIDAAWQHGGGTLSGAVALDSSAGTIRLSAASDLGVRAQSFSMFGQGPKVGSAQAGSSLVVDAERLQVSAPKGMVFEGRSAQGEVAYRLMSRGQSFEQLKLAGGEADRVLLPRSDVSGAPLASATATALGAASTPGFAQFVQQVGQGVMRPSSVDTGSQTRSYLQRMSEDLLSGLSWSRHVRGDLVLLEEADESGLEGLLSDLAYGFAEEERPSFVLGLPGLQPSSTGVSAQSVWLFDFAVE